MKIKHLLIGFFAICLTSCMDIFETINLNADGSGTYVIKMEMGEMIGMMAAMGGMNDKTSSNKKKEKMDSSFSFANRVDTMQNITKEQKEVLRKAGGKIHVDEAKGEMWVEMKFPFANGKEFELIQESMDKNNTKDFGVLDNLMGSKTDGMNLGDDAKLHGDGLPMAKTKYSLTENSFSRISIPAPAPPQESANLSEAKNEVALSKKMMSMMEMTMSFTLNLAKPATKITAKDAVVSEDKKQLKFKKKVSMEELSKAELFNFSVEF